MNIPSIIFKNKNTIQNEITEFLNIEKCASLNVSPVVVESVDRLLAFVKNGKCIRGGLVLFSAQMYGKKVDKQAIRLAAAIEIIHSSLLIHDDIMDNDLIRRGSPSMFAQYQQKAAENDFKNQKLYGQGMAISLGDIGFFLADKLISYLEISSETKVSLIQFLSKELFHTGIAQMQDLEFASNKEIPSEQDILKMYTYKTGRYSFVLPLVLGALLADKNINELQKLEEIGELFGILFQIKDDEIGMFSKDTVSGKPQGSDIREGKKTLLYRYLIMKANTLQKQSIEKVFGSNTITESDLKEIENIINELDIKSMTQSTINSLVQKIQTKIKDLNVNKSYQQVFYSLLEFSVNRTH